MSLSEGRRVLAVVAIAYLLALASAGLVVSGLGGAHPVLAAAIADVVATAVVFAFSVAYNNSSLYDPYWSVAPVPLCLFWMQSTWQQGALGARHLLVLTLVLVWGTRLTVNCLARWRSLADEDFRYVELRGKTGRAYWVVSFLGIHLAPTAWVFLGLLPLYPVLAGSSSSLGPLDLAALVVTASAITIETIADRQLHAFQQRRRDPADVLDAGLWSWSRHPNYFGEVLFWWGLYLFGLAHEPRLGWSIIGPLAITLLFVCVSVPWMDRRMLARHPAWREQLRGTSALIPLPKRA